MKIPPAPRRSARPTPNRRWPATWARAGIRMCSAFPLGEANEGSVIHIDLDTHPRWWLRWRCWTARASGWLGVKEAQWASGWACATWSPCAWWAGVGVRQAGAAFHVLVRAEGTGRPHPSLCAGRPQRARERSGARAQRRRRPPDATGAGGFGTPAARGRGRVSAGGPGRAGGAGATPPPRLDCRWNWRHPAAGRGSSGQGGGSPSGRPWPGRALLVRVVGKRPTDGELDAPYRLMLIPGAGEAAPPGAAPP
jgi:hypothetical protein